MLAETIGRLSVRRREKRDVRSMAAGSRRSTTLYCGVKRKSSNVQPRTRESRSVMRRATETQSHERLSYFF